MRRIDADELERDMQYEWERNEISNGDWISFREILNSQPTVDAVEVIRCRDCRYYEIMQLKRDGTDDRRYKPSLCVLHNRNFDEDYFCADGEKRDE